MESSYDIAVDPARHLMRITLSGFFDPTKVKQFAAAWRAGFDQLRCPANQHVTMVDVSDCKIQPQEVINAFGSLIGDPAHQARRLAFVVGGSLARMQVRRLLDGREARYFADASAAEAWLFADDLRRSA